jgi:D-serine deaminase-like pyridoxal phosphate-dependent protein
LHAYDGHICQTDPAERRAACLAAMAPVDALREALLAERLPVPRLVAGGSPAFPFHAERTGCECSPGTVVLWDASSAIQQPDLPFHCAAVVLTRVVSKPAEDFVCLDLGHKALASEMPHPRALFTGLAEVEAVKHSEEHLLLRTPQAKTLSVGDALLAVPWHICPTVALHAEAVIVEHGRVTGAWPIEARARRITV